MVGCVGYSKLSNMTEIFSNLSLTINITAGRDAFIGAIGASDGSIITKINSKMKADLTMQIVFGGIVGIGRDSTFETCFSVGQATLLS